MREIIDIYKDGNQWCAIYPMGSNLQECVAVEFAPERNVVVQTDGFGSTRIRDYGRFDALERLKLNHSLPTDSFHCEYWD